MGDVTPVCEHLILPTADARWTIHGDTMRADGPWLKHARRIEVVPLAEVEWLREALRDSTEYVRLGMTWIEDSDRHAKMKRAWERAREALDSAPLRGLRRSAEPGSS